MLRAKGVCVSLTVLDVVEADALDNGDLGGLEDILQLLDVDLGTLLGGGGGVLAGILDGVELALLQELIELVVLVDARLAKSLLAVVIDKPDKTGPSHCECGGAGVQ